MQRIAVFGGTFNPIHNGHIHLAKKFAEVLEAEKVLIIPTNVPPHKRAANLASASDRLAMSRLAVKSDFLFEVSDIEIRRGGPSYTSDTLRELKGRFPDDELYLITGEDMFVTLDKWHEPEVIFSLATVCAAPRSDSGCAVLSEYAEKLKKQGAKTRIESIKYLPVSSTMVRNAIKNGENILQYVPKAVEQYIHKNHLYQE